MGRIYVTGGGLSLAQVQAIVQQEFMLNPPTYQTPRYSSAPINPIIGLEYYNTSENKAYIFTPIGWKEIDTKDGIELQDLEGNVILLD